MDMSLSKLWKTVKDREAWYEQSRGMQRVGPDSASDGQWQLTLSVTLASAPWPHPPFPRQVDLDLVIVLIRKLVLMQWKWLSDHDSSKKEGSSLRDGVGEKRVYTAGCSEPSGGSDSQSNDASGCWGVCYASRRVSLPSSYVRRCLIPLKCRFLWGRGGEWKEEGNASLRRWPRTTLITSGHVHCLEPHHKVCHPWEAWECRRQLEVYYPDLTGWDGGLPWWLKGKQSTYQYRRLEFHPWVRKIPWRRLHSSIVICEIPWIEEPGQLMPTW